MKKAASLFALLPLIAQAIEPESKEPESMYMINSSSRFTSKNGYNLYFDAEFLYWIAQEDGLYFAQEKAGPGSNFPGGFDFSGDLKRIENHWRPGFRLGLGGNMPYDQWDIFLNWTWFYNFARNKAHGEVVALWGHPDASGTQLSHGAKAHWKLHYNILDVELGRAIWIGKSLSVRPFLGIRGAWIDQTFHIDYDYLVTGNKIDGEIHAETDFQGGGIRLGVDSRFAMWDGWSVYGIGSGSLLYGHFDTDFLSRFAESKAGRTEDDFRRGVSSFQLAIGIRWDHAFHHGRYHLGVNIGWEQNMWFDINHMNHYLSQLGQGILVEENSNLTLQGGTLGLRLDF